MLELDAGARALDYFPCRYGASRALFRGPACDLTRPYIAVLGGAATFGKYVARPYPAVLSALLDLPVVNLGVPNAGPDFWLGDPEVLAIAARAQVAVVQIPSAEAISNPFYTVHGRRNDRVLTATPALRALYPELDLADIHFARHLLQALERCDARRFEQVVAALRAAWLARMRRVLAALPPHRVLLWLADTALPSVAERLGDGPLFVDQRLIAQLADRTPPLVEAVPSDRARALRPLDMVFPETEAAQALGLPGTAAHAEVAAALVPAIRRMV